MRSPVGGNDDERNRDREISALLLLLLLSEIPLASAPRGALVCLKPLQVIMVIVCVYVRGLMFTYGLK